MIAIGESLKLLIRCKYFETNILSRMQKILICTSLRICFHLNTLQKRTDAVLHDTIDNDKHLKQDAFFAQYNASQNSFYLFKFSE